MLQCFHAENAVYGNLFSIRVDLPHNGVRLALDPQARQRVQSLEATLFPRPHSGNERSSDVDFGLVIIYSQYLSGVQ